MSFGNLLKKYRERVGLSKSELAASIEKTDGYIRQVENQGYTPPQYELCKKIATLLKLSDDERKEIYRAAFFERSKGDEGFLKELIKSPSAESKVAWFKSGPKESYCRYFLTWNTKQAASFLSVDIRAELTKLISEHVKEAECSLLGLDFSEHTVFLEMACDAEMKVDEFIQGLKETTVRQLKQHFPDLRGLGGGIWDDGYKVTTEKGIIHPTFLYSADEQIEHKNVAKRAR